MSIIFKNRAVIFLLILLAMVESYAPCLAKDKPNQFALETELSFGVSYSLNSKNAYDIGDYSRAGVIGNLRLLWVPDNKLKVGLETGIVPISYLKNDKFTNEYGITNLTAGLEAYPILLVFSMNIIGLDAYAGFGYYFSTSTTSAFGEKTISNEIDFGAMLALAYYHEVYKRMKVGAELKYNVIAEMPQNILSLQLKISYSILRW